MTSTATQTKPQTPWWGSFTLAEGELRRWQVGERTVWVHNQRYEWGIYERVAPKEQVAEAKAALPTPLDEIPEDASLTRFSFQRPTSKLTLTPVLADRAVVLKPEMPLFVPKGEETTLFVSTPLWLRLEVDKLGQLLEVPSQQLSDTWFGPSTLVGELCYASRATVNTELDAVAFEPHRAVTPLRVKNLADSPLQLERIKLPVRYLAVYKSGNPSDNRLWTQTVTLEREAAGDLAGLQLGKGAPREAGKTERLSAPRQRADKNLVVRAFSKLFSTQW